MKLLAALDKHLRRWPCVAATVLIGLASLGTESSATPPSIPPPRPPERLCFDSQGSIFVMKKGEMLPEGSYRCRDEIVWDEGHYWICRFREQLLLSDAPLDRILSFDVFERPKTNELSCLPIETQNCGGQTKLVTSKMCHHALTTDTDDFWRKFAEDANRPEQPVEQTCNFLGKALNQFFGLQALLQCSRESCILEQKAAVYTELINFVGDPGSSEPLSDLSAVQVVHTVSDERRISEQIAQAGIYCLDMQVPEATAVSHPPQPVIRSARLLQELPPHWNQFHPLFKREDTESNDAFLRCKSDLDCVPGKRPGVCMHKALAQGRPSPSTETHRCECVRGPVVHGCVARKTGP